MNDTEVQCDRCLEFTTNWCEHGLVLCVTCAPFCCQTCECQLADYAALIEQRRAEHYR